MHRRELRKEGVTGEGEEHLVQHLEAEAELAGPDGRRVAEHGPREGVAVGARDEDASRQEDRRDDDPAARQDTGPGDQRRPEQDQMRGPEPPRGPARGAATAQKPPAASSWGRNGSW